MDAARAVRLVAQIAAALDAAHARGLVHRDVKPANVLVGEGDHVYLSDFGLSREASQTRLTRTGLFVGSTDYAAPEQVRGEATDARTDVYALGCVLFQLLTGSVPFARSGDMAKMYAHITEPPPLVSDTRPELPEFDAIVERAMAKEPDDRHQSAGELAREALAAIRPSSAAHRVPAPPPAPVAPAGWDTAPVGLAALTPPSAATPSGSVSGWAAGPAGTANSAAVAAAPAGLGGPAGGSSPLANVPGSRAVPVPSDLARPPTPPSAAPPAAPDAAPRRAASPAARRPPRRARPGRAAAPSAPSRVAAAPSARRRRTAAPRQRAAPRVAPLAPRVSPRRARRPNRAAAPAAVRRAGRARVAPPRRARWGAESAGATAAPTGFAVPAHAAAPSRAASPPHRRRGRLARRPAPEADEPRVSPWPKRRRVALIAALPTVLVAGIAAAALAATGVFEGEAPRAAAAPTATATATATPTATATATPTAAPAAAAVETIEVGKGPDGVAVSDGQVFVANHGDGTLSTIDPETNEAERPDRGRHAAGPRRRRQGRRVGRRRRGRHGRALRERPAHRRASRSGTGRRRSRSASSCCGSPTATTARSTASTGPRLRSSARRSASATSPRASSSAAASCG